MKHGIVTGEPGDQKWSRRVREGGLGKGPQGTSPRPYLSRPKRRESPGRQAPLPECVPRLRRTHPAAQRQERPLRVLQGVPPRSNRNPMDNRASARRDARLATPLRPPALLIRLVAHPRSPPRRASARTPRRRRLATRQRRRRRVRDLESRARGRPHRHTSPDRRSHTATITCSTSAARHHVQLRAHKARVIASRDTLISSARVGSARPHRQRRGPPSAGPGRFAAQGQDLGRPPFTVKGRPARPVVTSRSLPVRRRFPFEDLSGRSHSVSDTDRSCDIRLPLPRAKYGGLRARRFSPAHPLDSDAAAIQDASIRTRATFSAVAEDRLNAERAGVVVAARRQEWLQRRATIGVAQLQAG